MSEVESKMNSAVLHYEKELNSLRTSRANPSMLDNIFVDAYGSQTPINQLGNISTPDPSMLTIQVWDTSLLKNIESSIIEACKLRFRPIIMTSLSTMIAMMPLVIGNIGPGAGEGSRLAVGATILGGMIISTFFTLYVTPTMYLTLAKNSQRIDSVDLELKKQLSKK